MEPTALRAAFDAQAQVFLDTVADDPDAVVPSCPGWDTSELLRHCVLTWGWAGAVVRTGQRADYPADPELSGDPLIEWGRQEAKSLAHELAQADPDGPCWTFGLPRSNLFWFRRQALETALHAWDATNAAGKPDALDPEVAVEGIREFLDLAVTRVVSRHPEGWDGQTVHLHRTDGEGEWYVRLGPDGEVAVEERHAKGDLAVRGPAKELYLWCSNRIPLDDLQAFGDLELAERWRTHIRF